MEIRLLIPPPWPMLAPLVQTSREEGFRFLIRLEQEYLSGKVRFQAAGETLLGAFEDSAIIGVGGLTRDTYSDDPHAGRIRHVYVLPQYRGRGIGRFLVADVERRGRPHFNALVLRTDTLAGARFYEAIGYEQFAISGTATHRRLLAL